MANNDYPIIGSHVSMGGPNYYLGSVEEALKYGANTLMLYTGAPQNTIRTPIEKLKIKEAIELASNNNMDISKFVCHAPYLINLGNSIDEYKAELGRNFLASEMERTHAMGIKVIVLHPGAHMQAGIDVGLDTLIKNLNMVLDNDKTGVLIALETMAGKGSELCTELGHLKYVINSIHKKDQVGVCLDTCHLNDAGYNLKDFDNFIKEIENTITLEKVFVIHINDSKNPLGAHKDRHENIGYGSLGFDTILKFVNAPQFKDVPKILETPYVEDYPPYKEEIEMLRNNSFSDWRK